MLEVIGPVLLSGLFVQYTGQLEILIWVYILRLYLVYSQWHLIFMGMFTGKRKALAQDCDPVILNIEIKDAKAINSCLELIRRYIDENIDFGVNFDSIYFCSFNHQSLFTLKEGSSKIGINNVKVAPAIKTVLPFGKENVNSDFTVKPGVTYEQEGIKYLNS